jgi:CO/xanthine dehydrogenase Mo-binding subunit
MTGSVGRRAPRVDAIEKVTGAAVYGSDVRPAGMLHGAVLRSPHAHARIVAIDVSRASRAPGVRAVVTGRDFPFTFGSAIKDQPFLAIDRVRYVGEPVVAVAAESEREAQQALDLIAVDYEPLPAALDLPSAIAEGAPLVHPDLHDYERGSHHIVPHSNVNTLYRFDRGDIEAGFASADLVVEEEYRAQAVSHAALETHASVAAYDPARGAYTLWVSTDRPFHVRDELAGALGLPSTRVRLVVGYVGGSFGGKNTLVSEAVAVALARHTGGRPVRVEFSREEDLVAAQLRVPAILRLKTGVTSGGILVAQSADILWNSGAYTSNTVGVAIRGAQSVVGPYRTPNVEIVSRQVYTNTAITGSYRGYGVTQVTWACESQMDVIADRLGIDPLELRLRNAYEEGDSFLNGQIMRGVNVRESLERAADEIGWGSVERRPAPHLRRGKGIAALIKPTATPTSSNCVIEVQEDGDVVVLCSAPEIGSGQSTVLAQMAADTIGVPLERVSIPLTDTSSSPYNGPVASSRTTFHVGNAIRLAGEEVRAEILRVAADALGADPEVLDLRDGTVCEGAVARLALGDLLRGPAFSGRSVIASARYSSAGSPLLKAEPGLEWMSSIFWMVGAQAAEVEVDVETGVVRVVKVAAAHDVGRAINPVTCEQQIEGGVVMGLSNALFEEFHVRDGRIENGSFADYKIATIEDMPEIVPIIVESEHPEAPFGAKGVGEPAAAATPPAIANALYDAIGVRIRELPLTAERVLAAISVAADERDASRSASGGGAGEPAGPHGSGAGDGSGASRPGGNAVAS